MTKFNDIALTVLIIIAKEVVSSSPVSSSAEGADRYWYIVEEKLHQLYRINIAN